MSDATKNLRYNVIATDNASAKLGAVAATGEKTSARIGSAFSKLGGAIGGEVGEVLTRVGEGFDHLGEKGMSAGQKIGVAGTVMAGAGALLTAMGSKEKQATDQLAVSIQNTGHDVEDFSKQIEDTVTHMEKYGDTAVTTKNALATLTNATHDPAKALKEMQVAADLAAASHISLDSAASQVAKALGGSGRIFKQYGIQVGLNADGTKNYSGAVDHLGQVLNGQANASVNNITGKFDHLKAVVEDGAAAFGQKYGPAITTLGVSMVAFAPLASKVGDGIKAIGGKIAEMIGHDAEAGASSMELAGAVEASAVSQDASFAQVVTGAETASAAAVQADTAAEVSTGELADAVVTSAATQLTAFADVAAGAKVSSTIAVASDDAIITANTEVAASAEAATVAESGMALGMTAGVAALAAIGAAAYFGGKALSNFLEKGNPMDGMIHGIDKLNSGFDGLRTSIVNATGPASDIEKQFLDGKLQSSGLADSLAKTGITTEQTTAAIMAGKDATEFFIKSMVDSGKMTKAQAVELAVLAGGYEKVAGSAKPAATTTDTVTTAFKNLYNAGVSADHAVTALKNTFDRLDGANMTVEQSVIQMRDAVDQLTSSFGTNGRTLDDNTTAGRANLTQVFASIQAVESNAEAVQKSTGSTDQANAAFMRGRDAIQAQLEKLGLAPAAVQKLLDKYAKVPDHLKTTIDITDEASAKLAALLKRLKAEVAGTPLTVTVGADGAVFHQKGNGRGAGMANAGGSDDFPGGTTLVGERGPEVVDLPRGSRIIPASSHGGSGGGTTNHFTVNVYAPVGANMYEAGRQVAAALETYAQSGQIRIAHAVN